MLQEELATAKKNVPAQQHFEDNTKSAIAD